MTFLFCDPRHYRPTKPLAKLVKVNRSPMKEPFHERIKQEAREKVWKHRPVKLGKEGRQSKQLRVGSQTRADSESADAPSQL